MLAANLNFSKASEALHISQSALSAAIQGLEEALSTRLFDRSTRIVELTPTGQLLRKEAEELLAHFDHSIQRVQDFVSGAQGRLQIAASPSVMAGLLPLALSPFNEMYPGVAVEVREEVHATCIYLVRARKVDFALTPGRQGFDDLCQTKLFDDRLVALCAPGHPIARQETVKWASIIKERIIAVSRDSSVRQIVETAFARYASELHPAVEVERATSAMSFAAAGLGIAIMPLSLVKYADSQYLVRRPIDASDAVRTICAIRLATRTPSSAAENFIDLCKQMSRTS
jgi:DNA-binding transcriptional LysR family regulator